MTLYDCAKVLAGIFGALVVSYVLFSIVAWLWEEVLEECKCAIREKRPIDNGNIAVIDWQCGGGGDGAVFLFFTSPIFLVFVTGALIASIVQIIWLRWDLSMTSSFGTVPFQRFAVKVINSLLGLNAYKKKD